MSSITARESSTSDRLKSPAAADLARLVSVRELAGVLHMSQPAIRAAVARGVIPALRLGTRIRFDLEQVRAAFRPCAGPKPTGAA